MNQSPMAFYEMLLPKFEVVVPEKDKDVRAGHQIRPPRRAAAPMYCRPARTGTSPMPTACRAKLALQGIESNVQKVTVDNDTWHRIRIGPISKLDDLKSDAPKILRTGRCSMCW